MTEGVAADLMAILIGLDDIVSVHVIYSVHAAAAEGTGDIIGAGPPHITQDPAAFGEGRSRHIVEAEAHHRFDKATANGIESYIAGEARSHRGESALDRCH